jgi:hypothetical protein
MQFDAGDFGKAYIRGVRACVRTRICSLVPQGRLNLAQDASPGYIMKHDRLPQGRLKVVQDCVAAYFSAVPAGLVVLSNPTQDCVLG